MIGAARYFAPRYLAPRYWPKEGFGASAGAVHFLDASATDWSATLSETDWQITVRADDWKIDVTER